MAWTLLHSACVHALSFWSREMTIVRDLLFFQFGRFDTLYSTITFDGGGYYIAKSHSIFTH